MTQAPYLLVANLGTVFNKKGSYAGFESASGPGGFCTRTQVGPSLI